MKTIQVEIRNEYFLEIRVGEDSEFQSFLFCIKECETALIGIWRNPFQEWEWYEDSCLIRRGSILVEDKVLTLFSGKQEIKEVKQAVMDYFNL